MSFTYFVCVLFIRRVVKVLLSVLSVLGANPRLQPYGGAPPAPGFRRFAIPSLLHLPIHISLLSPSPGITTHFTCLLRAFWTGPGLLQGTKLVKTGAFISDVLFSSSASIATNGELTFSSTFGGGSAQLTRIDESSLTGQLNLRCLMCFAHLVV